MKLLNVFFIVPENKTKIRASISVNADPSYEYVIFIRNVLVYFNFPPVDGSVGKFLANFFAVYGAFFCSRVFNEGKQLKIHFPNERLIF